MTSTHLDGVNITIHSPGLLVRDWNEKTSCWSIHSLWNPWPDSAVILLDKKKCINHYSTSATKSRLSQLLQHFFHQGLFQGASTWCPALRCNDAAAGPEGVGACRGKMSLFFIRIKSSLGMVKILMNLYMWFFAGICCLSKGWLELCVPIAFVDGSYCGDSKSYQVANPLLVLETPSL